MMFEKKRPATANHVSATCVQPGFQQMLDNNVGTFSQESNNAINKIMLSNNVETFSWASIIASNKIMLANSVGTFSH